MDFEWDEAKRKDNLRKHGIDFVDIPEAFEGPLLVRMDWRRDYGEDRWIGIGYVQGRTIVVCFTDRHHGRTVRVISARKALSHERKIFEEKIANELGKGG
jgi:uncharacterized DUF497 family protein